MPLFENRPIHQRRSCFMRKTNLANNMQRWAVILAGGDGNRLLPLTRLISGDDRPKQFCSLFGGPTLLELTKQRVGLLLPAEQTLTIVTRHHERFYKHLPDLRSNKCLVQPSNKGTAAAIMLGLLRVTQLSPEALVAFLPSDHYISNKYLFMFHVDSAFRAAEQQPNRIILLGIKPDSPEVEYGWIEPTIRLSGENSDAMSPVRRFWEKPSAPNARRLMRDRCLWNSFVMVGQANAFLESIRLSLPELYKSLSSVAPALGTADQEHALAEIYSSISCSNFSTEVLASCPDRLLVRLVADVGWSDLGEPSRALSAIRRNRSEVRAETQPADPSSWMRNSFLENAG